MALAPVLDDLAALAARDLSEATAPPKALLLKRQNVR